jgi:hypothetical protein
MHTHMRGECQAASGVNPGRAINRRGLMRRHVRRGRAVLAPARKIPPAVLAPHVSLDFHERNLPAAGSEAEVAVGQPRLPPQFRRQILGAAETVTRGFQGRHAVGVWAFAAARSALQYFVAVLQYKVHCHPGPVLIFLHCRHLYETLRHPERGRNVPQEPPLEAGVLPDVLERRIQVHDNACLHRLSLWPRIAAQERTRRQKRNRKGRLDNKQQ